MCFTFRFGSTRQRGGGHVGGFIYDTSGGVICVTMAVPLCGVMGAVKGMWCVCGGLRCAAASPPVLLFGAPPEQPPGLVVQEKQSYYIALLLIAHSALRSAMGMPDLM